MSDATETPPPRPRRRRLLLFLPLGALGLLILLAVSVPLALRSAGVRAAVLERVGDAVAEATGIHVTAADFTVDWRRTGVELRGVELRAASGAAPFVTADRVWAEIRLESLRTSDIRLRRVDVDTPFVDLDAPLPGSRPEKENDGPGRTLSIERFEVKDGALALADDTFAEDSWLERLTFGGVDFDGAMEANALVGVEVPRATVTATRRGAELVELALEGRLDGPLTGPLTVGDLSLAGPGLDLDAAGRIGYDAEQPFDLDFTVAVEPDLLVPDLTTGGSLRAEGRFDARRRAGRADVEASDVPAELIEPWLGREAMERLGAAGTRLDATADLDLDAGTITGKGAVDWRRGEVRLLTADADLERLRMTDDGTLDLDSLAGTLRVTARDVAPELVEPWLGAGTFEQLAAAGTRLDLTADVDLKSIRGPGAPGHADIVWRDGETVLLAASMRASEAGRGLPIELRGELLPASPGRRVFSGRLRADGWSELAAATIAGGRVEIELPDLAAALAELRGRWPLLVPEATEDPLLEGSLSVASDVAGPPASPRLDGTATWRRPDGAVLTLTGAGEPLAKRGDARLEVEALDLAALRELLAGAAPDLAGRVSGSMELAAGADGWTAALSADGEAIVWDPELPPIDRLTLEADGDASRLRIVGLDATAGERHLTASGDLELAPPLPDAGTMPRLERAELRIEVERPLDGLARVLADVTLADGTAKIDASEIDLTGGRGELRATVPLAALADLPEVGDAIAAWTGPDRLAAAPAEGPIDLRFTLPALDAATLLDDLEAEAPETFTVAAHGELVIDPADPTAASGTLELPTLTVGWDGHRLEAVEPVRLRLADRRLSTEHSRLELDGRRLELDGSADLEPGWRPGDPVASGVRRVDARLDGVVHAELLNPYLGGAAATGPVRVDLDLEGPLDHLSGRLNAHGPEARLVAFSPYFTRLESPRVELELEEGRTVLTLGKARLNQGTVELTGTRDADGALELFADVESVRYRLDYGLSTVLSGDLYLTLPAEGRGRLEGRLIVERGLLRRDLNLEREVLGRILAPAQAAAGGDPDDLLNRIDLDLDVAAADGVRIKNNLADLRATWSPISVRGSLAAPRIDGRIDVEGGGFAYLYGQTLRVDQATVTLVNYPELPPELDLSVTSSLDDPSVAREGAADFRWTPATQGAEQAEADRQALLAAGVASHYADQLVGRLGQALGGTRISVAPLLVFGETDPGARLTVSRDLSTHVAVAVSADLRSEGRQVYLLDLHEFRRLPRMSAQLFTNDARNQGVILQQSFELGGQVDEALRRLHRIRIEVPDGFEVKGLPAATGLRRGDRLPEGVDFDAEVDMAEHLRQKGYPGAGVKVRIEPAAGGARDLIAVVEPGPRIDFNFQGTSLPRAARRSIRSLYRTDYFEPAAIEEMRRETVRALHGQGYPSPEVTIEVKAGDGDGGGDDGPDRTVVIEAQGGEKMPIDEVEMRGVPDEVADRLEQSFAAQGDRIALAAGLEDADRRLIGLLRGAGYPEPRIASRRREEGEKLIVELEPGIRRRIAEVTIEGIGAEEAARLETLLEVAAGDPARSDLIAGGAVTIERDLRRRGYVEARARPRTAVPEPGSLDLTYQVDAGQRYDVEDIRFDGATATTGRWAERVTHLERDEPVDPEELGEARRRLFDTGLFRSVVPDTELGPDGRATVVFGVRERPRYEVSYGLRWESSIGAGAVVDAFDRNAFGRGVTLGARALYAADDESARIYSIFPQVFGTHATLEVYLEGRRLREQGDAGALLTNRSEGTFQVSYPLGEHTTTRGYYRYRDSHRFEENPGPASDFELRLRNPVLGWQLVHDTRDDKIDATRGLLSSLDLTGAGDELGADTRFVRFFGKTSIFRRILGTRRGPVIWAQSLRVGLAEAFGGQELSRDDRFLAGGELSVRGYREQSLGPREMIGSTLIAAGGEALLVVNQELRWPLPWGLHGVAFFDAGNVWESPSDLGGDLSTAAGLGLRASTPVGLVRLDVAFPFDRRPEDDEVKIYLGLGNVF